MRRPLFTTLLLVPALFAVGCTDTRQPTAPYSPNAELTGAPSASASDIRAQIVALFPPPGLRTAALAQFNNIARQMAAGLTADARAKMFDLVAFTVEKLGQHRLLDPNGPNPPTTSGAVLDVINALYAFVGLTPPVPPQAQGPDGAVSVIGSGGGDLLPEHRLAGLRVPAGAVSGDHLFVIARRDDLAKQGTCLTTLFTQYPLCYDYAVFPATTFAVNVTVVVCQLEPPPPDPIRSRLVLAHPGPNGAAQFTTRVADPFSIVCTDAVLEGGGLGGLLRRIRALAGRLIGPPPLYASHGGLGGSTGSFSAFIGIDPLSAVGVCPAGPVDDLMTFTTFPAALAAVPSGGKIEVCSGAFTAENVEITTPVTIEAAPGAATAPLITTSTTNANGFSIDAVPSGTVAFRRLSFTSTGTGVTSIAAFTNATGGTYDQVTVDNSSFTVGPNGAGVFGGSSTVAGAKVVVANSSFTGGDVGVFASGDVDASGQPILATAPHFDVLNSTLHDFTFSGIQYQAGASGRISGNTVSACGFAGCIRSRSDNQIEISGNAVTVDAGRITSNSHIRWGIAADVVVGGSHLIVGNTITGVGGGGDPSNPASYAIRFAGIGLGRIRVDPANTLPQLGNATLSRNTIVNADTGLSAHDAVITGTDNVITGTLVGIAGVNVTTTTSLSLNRSDVTSYVVPMAGDGLVDLTCNWWGSDAGPLNVPEGVPAGVFTPFATLPIANNASVTCGSGAIGAPTINRSLTAPLTQQLAPATTGTGTAPFKRPVML